MSQPTLTAGICREDDSKWPQKNKDGRQELEIRLGNDHISFEVRIVHSQARVSIRITSTDKPPDSQDRITGGCDGICRSGGAPSLLLPRSRFESFGVQPDFSTLQDQAYLGVS